jgi:hypothetical protein
MQIMRHKIELGTGVLGWERSERVTDRYGAVLLMDGPNWDAKGIKLAVAPEHLGKLGKLVAEVLETRQSGHLGDWFHGVGPSTPTVGERIVLGTGKLFTGWSEDCNATTIGLKPLRPKKDFWLDPKKLYRAHDQTVRLVFEES